MANNLNKVSANEKVVSRTDKGGNPARDYTKVILNEDSDFLIKRINSYFIVQSERWSIGFTW